MGLITFIILTFINAPYGRHRSAGGDQKFQLVGLDNHGIYPCFFTDWPVIIRQ